MKKHIARIFFTDKNNKHKDIILRCNSARNAYNMLKDKISHNHCIYSFLIK